MKSYSSMHTPDNWVFTQILCNAEFGLLYVTVQPEIRQNVKLAVWFYRWVFWKLKMTQTHVSLHSPFQQTVEWSRYVDKPWKPSSWLHVAASFWSAILPASLQQPILIDYRQGEKYADYNMPHVIHFHSSNWKRRKGEYFSRSFLFLSESLLKQLFS